MSTVITSNPLSIKLNHKSERYVQVMLSENTTSRLSDGKMNKILLIATFQRLIGTSVQIF